MSFLFGRPVAGQPKLIRCTWVPDTFAKQLGTYIREAKFQRPSFGQCRRALARLEAATLQGCRQKVPRPAMVQAADAASCRLQASRLWVQECSQQLAHCKVAGRETTSCRSGRRLCTAKLQADVQAPRGSALACAASGSARKEARTLYCWIFAIRNRYASCVPAFAMNEIYHTYRKPTTK